MEVNEENIQWALAKFEALADMDGFPTTEASLRARARAFLRIVGPIKPDWYEIYDPTIGGPKRITVPGHTAEETADWLIEEINDKCERFPPAIVMRRLYESHPDGWRASDGRRSADMVLED